jgi:hypothetical protein
MQLLMLISTRVILRDSGVPLEDIIAAADLSSATTFERFYHKAISKDKFVKSILAPDVQK